MSRNSNLFFVASATTLLLVACDRTDVTEYTGPRATVCHTDGTSSAEQSVPISELGDRARRGEYATQLVVDPAGTSGDSIHFLHVADAIAAVRAGRIARHELESAACRITITVAAGVVAASTASSNDPLVEKLPFVIDVPDITVRGALKMQVDGDKRATGVGDGSLMTTIAPSPALTIVGGATAMTGSPEPIFIVNGHPDGSKGNGAVIEGFVLQSGRAASDTTVGGFGILVMRANAVVVRGNRFESGLTSGVDLRASAALVENNYLTGRGSSCDICLAGPGDYRVQNNRTIGGGIPGVLILPAVLLPVPSVVEQYVLPTSSLITAVVANNEVRDHVRKPVGVGLRIGAIGVGAPNVVGTSRVTLTNNNLVNNTFGIIVEAAFVRDLTTRRGDIEVTTSGNTFAQSCQNNLLVTMSSSQVGLGIQSGPSLLNSTYTLTLGADIPWSSAWFASVTGMGNTLMVNGQSIAAGAR